VLLSHTTYHGICQRLHDIKLPALSLKGPRHVESNASADLARQVSCNHRMLVLLAHACYNTRTSPGILMLPDILTCLSKLHLTLSCCGVLRCAALCCAVLLCAVAIRASHLLTVSVVLSQATISSVTSVTGLLPSGWAHTPPSSPRAARAHTASFSWLQLRRGASVAAPAVNAGLPVPHQLSTDAISGNESAGQPCFAGFTLCVVPNSLA